MTDPDFLFSLPPGDIAYDIETFPNVFTFRATHTVTGQKWKFEISFRRNDLAMLCLFIERCQVVGVRWVGYNNIGFDYPVVHFIYMNRNAFVTVLDIYNKAMSIINAPHNARFSHLVWESDWLVPQVDLYKIHHFDNMARATSLKVLEFNMRMDSIEDLPFDVGTMLDSGQADVLLDYNDHDVDATVDFYHESKDLIEFREEITAKYGRSFINHNDTKIGKDFFIMRLEDARPGSCYSVLDGKRHINQTKRDSIALGDVILPYVQFQHPEFQRIHKWFNATTITETKGSIKDIHCTIDGFQFDFGTGGIHGSIESQIVCSDDDYIIEDWDVASYYPNLAIANQLSPEHLGSLFCAIYEEVYKNRVTAKKLMKAAKERGDMVEYAKQDAIQAVLKLALNGVYGDSNNQYSPFYDPKYTMSITINGQLLLCMLAEVLLGSTDVKMIQINTDGLTIRYPRVLQEWVHSVAKWWENLTNLELESAEYSRFMVRDVNNYIAEYTDGKLKRKGAYEYDLGWHQNHSALVVAKAAEAALVHNTDIREFITNHADVYDFFLRTKVPRSSTLEWGGDRVANIVRYYISTEGHALEKVMPPAGPEGQFKRANKLTDQYVAGVMAEIGDGVWDERIHTKNKSVYEERRSGVNTGWVVDLCNNMNTLADCPRNHINYEWYIKEAEKLVKPLLAGC